MTQGDGETPGIGGIPGLPHKSGDSINAYRKLMGVIGVYGPKQLRRAQRTRAQMTALSRRRR